MSGIPKRRTLFASPIITKVDLARATITQGIVDQYIQDVYYTRDKEFKEALIKLGWTPPKELHTGSAHKPEYGKTKQGE